MPPKPLRSFPVSHRRQLWKIAPYDPKKAYTTRMPSKRTVTVLEEGSREVHRQKVEPDLPGRFVVEGCWLVYVSYPRAAEELRRDQSKQAAADANRASELAAAKGSSAFKAFILRLNRELGRARTARACDREHRAYRAPSDARCAELIQEARRSGASATLFLAPWARELRVVPGGIGALAALFDWNTYGPGDLAPALEALDAAAGLTLDHVFNEDQFSLHLDRTPHSIAPIAKVLAARLQFSMSEMVAALEARVLTVGEPPSTWTKFSDAIYDPGVDEGDDDEGD